MIIDQTLIDKCQSAANKMRKRAIDLAFLAGANGAHIAPGLSIIEITACLFCGIMKYRSDDPKWPDRDRFILSKGHGTLGYYTALEVAGIITTGQLDEFEKNGGPLPGQPSANLDLGVEFSSGTLGLGLSYGLGISLAAKQCAKDHKVYVLMGDGECNEGSIWESAMCAAHYKLNNLIAIIDANSLQSDGKTEDVINTDLTKMWSGFGWEVINVNDGNDILQLLQAFATEKTCSRPRVIIAKTIKGKGISFMENNNEWHHNRLSKTSYDLALNELLKYV